jgi:hypothetical protein
MGAGRRSCLVDEDFERLDGTRGSSLCPRKIIEGRERLGSPQVDHQKMRKRRFPGTPPESRLLEIKHFIPREVPPMNILTVNIFHSPRLPTDAIPIRITGIKLCNADLILPVMSRKALNGNKPALLWGNKANRLPTIT